MAAISDRNIRILPKAKIDKTKWDNCVSVNNGLIYNLYDYIDTLSDNWNGIVIGDYEAILAVPFKKKWGIRYIPTIPFLQQVSLLGSIDNYELGQVQKCILKIGCYGDLNLTVKYSLEDWTIKERTNYQLNLNCHYADICSKYHVNLKRNIAKAQKNDLLYEICDITVAVNTYFNFYNKNIPVLATAYFERFKVLVNKLLRNNSVEAFLVKKDSELLATALFFKYNGRIYNILPCTLDTGRQYAAMHFLLDKVIESNSNRDMIFDFEGSDLPGVKQFYQQFGPEKDTYYQYHFNKLPFPLNKIKR